MTIVRTFNYYFIFFPYVNFLLYFKISHSQVCCLNNFVTKKNLIRNTRETAQDTAGSNAEISHRESPVSETGLPGRVRLIAKQLRVLELPGSFRKSTVLLYSKHGDPGRAGFESGISFYVLLKFCT